MAEINRPNMHELERHSPLSLNSRVVHLRLARTDFWSFYRMAPESDAELMDDLIVYRAVATSLMAVPRAHLESATRDTLERVSDLTDHLLEYLRERVRNSQTFAALSDEDRVQIEQIAFQHGLPHGTAYREEPPGGRTGVGSKTPSHGPQNLGLQRIKLPEFR